MLFLILKFNDYDFRQFDDCAWAAEVVPAIFGHVFQDIWLFFFESFKGGFFEVVPRDYEFIHVLFYYWFIYFPALDDEVYFCGKVAISIPRDPSW